MKCIACGKEFKAKRATAQFCSGACKIKKYRKVSVTSEELSVTKKVSVTPFSVTKVGVSVTKVGVSVTKNIEKKVSVTECPVSVTSEELSVTKKTNPLKRITNAKEVNFDGHGGWYFNGEHHRDNYYQSNVYKNLMEELQAKPIKQLESEGYFIPCWKYAKVNPDKIKSLV